MKGKHLKPAGNNEDYRGLGTALRAPEVPGSARDCFPHHFFKIFAFNFERSTRRLASFECPLRGADRGRSNGEHRRAAKMLEEDTGEIKSRVGLGSARIPFPRVFSLAPLTPSLQRPDKGAACTRGLCPPFQLETKCRMEEFLAGDEASSDYSWRSVGQRRVRPIIAAMVYRRYTIIARKTRPIEWLRLKAGPILWNWVAGHADRISWRVPLCAGKNGQENRAQLRPSCARPLPPATNDTLSRSRETSSYSRAPDPPASLNIAGRHFSRGTIGATRVIDRRETGSLTNL